MLSILLSYKTTIAGVGAFCTSLGHLLTNLANGDTSSLATDLPMIMAALGLLFAKDHNVTGAK